MPIYSLLELYEIMVSFVSDIVVEPETWNYIISKCISWQEKPHWKTTVITGANLLLDRFSFTEVNSNEFTLHFCICAYCVTYSSNMSLPARAGVVQISLRFIQSCRGRRYRARMTDMRLQHSADVMSQPVCMFFLLERQRNNRTRILFRILSEMVTYPGWWMGGDDIKLKGFWNRILCCRELQWACTWAFGWLLMTESHNTRTEDPSLKIIWDRFNAGKRKYFSCAAGREFLEVFATGGLWKQLVSNVPKEIELMIH